MTDAIQTDLRPYDASRRVVCFNEARRQLFGEVRERRPAAPGGAAKADYEYEREGACNLFVMCAPLRGWRRVRVTDRRIRKGHAECLQPLVDVHCPAPRRWRWSKTT